MVQKPVVFISSTSDLRTARSLVGNVLHSMGYEPVWQDIEPTEGGELLEVLRQRIAPADFMIQLVGQRYGAEPPTSTPEFGRVSYTQFEALHAEALGLRVIYHFIDPAFPTDAVAPESDECRQLQTSYRQRIVNANKLRHEHIATPEALELSIHKIKNELAMLRQKSDRRFRRTFWIGAGTLVAVALVAILVGVVMHRQAQQTKIITTISDQDRKITKEKIRVQLLSAAEGAYAEALADADKAKDWKDRQRLKDAAKKEQDVRLSRIDELASSFADLEGTAKSSTIQDEVTRILAEQGVDQALAYVDAQATGILDSVKASAVQQHEKNRDHLRPLLTGAQLLASTGKLKEAASKYREILAIEPDWTDALSPDFWVLVDQGDRARNYDTTIAAMNAYTAAMAIGQHLAAVDAANLDWQRDLSVSFEKIGDIKQAQGDLAGALASYQQAMGIRKKLAAADAGNTQWQRDLSVSFENIGGIKQAQGDLAGALESYQQAMAIAKKLAAADAGNSQWQRDLSISFEKIGDIKQAQGDLGGALESYQQAMGIRKKLAAADAGNTDWQRDLSISLEKIGDIEQAQGDLAGALESHQQAMGIRKELAAADASNTEWQRDLSVSFNKVGDIKQAQGDLGGALASYQQAMAIAKKLAAADAGNSQWQRDLSVSFENIGDIKQAQGDLAGALAFYQQAMGIRQKLAAADASNAQWQCDLSVSFERIGEIKQAQGDLAGALAFYQQAMGIRQKLAAADASNAHWQCDLSVSFERIGEIKQAQGDLAGALESYQQYLAIAKKLAAADAGNTEWQRDLSISLEKIGEIKQAQGDLAGALESYQQAMGIRQKLAAADAGNAQWQRDLWVEEWKLADVLTKQGKEGQAKAHWQRAYDIIMDMKIRKLFVSADDEKILITLRDLLQDK